MSVQSFYTAIKLPGNEDKPYVMLRITPSGRPEALFQEDRGPLRLLRWDTYAPAGHCIARFTALDADGIADYENSKAVGGE